MRVLFWQMMLVFCLTGFGGSVWAGDIAEKSSLYEMPKDVSDEALRQGNILKVAGVPEAEVKKDDLKRVFEARKKIALVAFGAPMTGEDVTVMAMTTSAVWSLDTTYLLVRRVKYEKSMALYGPLSETASKVLR